MNCRAYRAHATTVYLLVLWLSTTPTVHSQQQEFTNDLYRVSGSGSADISQVLSTLVQVANTTYFEAADAQLQLNNYTSCSSAPESLQSTPPPPAAPPPPSNIVVNIGRKMLQAQLPAPALQTGKAVVVTSPAASQCWDLNFRVLLASTSQPLSRQNPNVTAFEGYSRLSRMDSLSSQQGLQVAWVAMETTLLLSTAYFQHASNMVSQNATQIVLQLSGPGVVPFSVAKQTLLLSYLQNETWGSTNAMFGRLTGFQQAGSAANVTLITLYDQNATSISYPQAVQSLVSSGALASGLTAAGLPVASASFLQSQEAGSETLLGQAQALLAANSTSGGPTGTTAAARKHGGELSTGALVGIVVGAIVATVTVAGLAAFTLLYSRRRQRKPPPREPLDSPQKPAGAPWTGSTPPDSYGTTSKGTSKVSMESLDKPLQGLESRAIDAKQVLICCHPDGSEWVLGQGSFGTVLKGRRLGLVEIDVAVKRLRVVEAYQLSQFRNEVNTLKVLPPHNHLVQFHGACMEEVPPMLVMEFLAGGDLRGALSNSQLAPSLTWYRGGRKLAMDIADGLAWLHTHKIIHSDLKTQNVLLTGDHGTAKIGDVGLSRVLHSTYTGNASNNVGTFTYAAPEAILGEKCDRRMDIWSLGVVLWELVTHAMPKRGQLRQLKVPQECPADIAALIDRCHQRYPRDRPSALEVLQVISNSAVAPDGQPAEAAEEVVSHWSGSNDDRSDISDMVERTPAPGDQAVTGRPGSLQLRLDSATLPPDFGQEHYGEDMQDHPAVRSILTRPSVEMVEWARQENEYADMHGPQEELLTTEDLQNFRRLDLQVEASKPSNKSIAGLPGMTGPPPPVGAWSGQDDQQQPTHQISVPTLPPDEPELEALPDGEAPFTHPFLEQQRTRSHSHRKGSQGSRKNSRRATSFKSGERQEIKDSIKFETHSEKMDEMLAAAGFGKRRDPENVFASFCAAPAGTSNPTLDTAHDGTELHRSMGMQRQSSRRPVPRPSADEEDQDEFHDQSEHQHDKNEPGHPHRYLALSNNTLLHTPGLLSSDADSHLLSTSNLQSSISDLDAVLLRSSRLNSAL